MALRLIVGLGNPGRQYEETRHNAGFQLLDRLATRENLRFSQDNALHSLIAKWPAPSRTVYLVKPNTFMNRSGLAVQAAMAFYRLTADDVLVVHDELDFVPGIARLKQGGGHGGHNGLRDIAAQLSGNTAYRRLRLGIGHPGDRARVASYVLERATLGERQAMDQAIDAALDVLPLMLADDWARAMNVLNTAG